MKRILFPVLIILQIVGGYTILEARPERGYYKDEYGRMLIFREQPSWWLVPIGGFTTLAGAFAGLGVYTGHLHASTRTSYKMGPVSLHASSYNTTGDRILAGIGCGCLSASGIAILYHWHYHYSRLEEPYVILDKNGMWFEGHGMLNWHDLKGVRLVEEPIRDGEGRVIGTKLLIEVVEIQKRWKIDDSRLAITREALYDFILEYCERATGKNPRIT